VDAPKNPEILERGIHITHGKYFRITGDWTQSNTEYSYIFMWLYPFDGIIGTFTDFMISVSLQMCVKNFIISYVSWHQQRLDFFQLSLQNRIRK
jgi:hypothetical protein